MAATRIEWCTDVWNPTTGCDRIGSECDHCYALTYAGRLKAMGQPAYQADGDPRTSGPGFAVTLHPERLAQSFGRRRDGSRRRIFVDSMSDLFHKEVPAEFIARVFDRMAEQPEHDFLVLTKRAKRMARVLDDYYADRGTRPHSNVWLGTSVGVRASLHRAEWLRQAPAAVRFISAEPLLEPLVDIMCCSTCSMEGEDPRCDECEGVQWWPLEGGLSLEDVDWLIVGGESGPDHRPIGEQWVRELRDLAVVYGTAFFFKQWGGQTPKAGGRELDGRIYSEIPRSPAFLVHG